MAPRSGTFAVVALGLGVIGLSMTFSDIGRGESVTSRVTLAALFFFFCGFAIGCFNPRAWIVSGLSAWGSVLFGALLVLAAIGRYGSRAFSAQEPPYISAGLVLLLLPLGLSLLGGYAGKRLRNRRTTR